MPSGTAPTRPAGGELPIPTLVLLHAVDTRLAGTLSLAISLPTLPVSLSRGRKAHGNWSLWTTNVHRLSWTGAD